MKRVLVITYYWPPAGGGGVQRWVKLTKYLPRFGWEPLVYAPDGADYPLIDPTLEREVPPGLAVIRRPILEPRRLYVWFAGSKARRSMEADEVFHRDSSQRTLKENAAVWLRGNLLIPDARVTWVRPSVRFLLRYLKDHPVDAIVTTGPPHSMHLIGRALRRRLEIPWVADFRDPWTRIEFYDDLMLTGRADARHRRLEAAVLDEADAVTTVSPTWASQLEGGDREVRVVTNGFDAEDFEERPSVDQDVFRIIHAGSLSMDRDPVALWEALSSMIGEIPGFRDRLRVRILGRADPRVAGSAERHGLKEYLEVSGYVPHPESIDAMCRAAVLLLLINRDERNAPGRIPGKLFEYLASRRPILVVGPPDGDAARIVRDCRAGAVRDYQDDRGITSILSDWYERHLEGRLVLDPTELSEFSRRAQAKAFAEVLQSAATDAAR